MLQRVEVRLSVDDHGTRRREFSRLRPEIRRVFQLLRIDPLILTQAEATEFVEALPAVLAQAREERA